MNPTLADAGQIKWQRRIFLAAGLALFALGLGLMTKILFATGLTAGKIVVLVLFAGLFVQLSLAFCVALTGFWLSLRGGDPTRINLTLPEDFEPGELPCTAVIMPVFNEDPERIFAGLRTTFESLQKTRQGDSFDFFILSDSNDPNHWVEEEKNWIELCKELNAFGRIFYRKRRVTLNHKSGNVADFCRRWGANYRYMIVLDADSVMRGDALVRMVALMEKNRTVGILQTAPRFVLGQTLFQRVHQFAGRVYGPMFLAGMNFWQMDHGCFWGHNAIVRLRPFMKYCALPELPKVGALGGRLLSHDTVEAALMQKAGYGVWVAYDIDGSYEESPPDLLTNLKRNRRWCHGNMQHWLVLFWRGLTSASRTQILFGIFAYANAPLWLLFLIVSTLVGFQEAGHAPVHHTGSVAGLALFLVVFVLLLLPKVLAVITVIRDPELKLFGGTFRLVASALGETIFTMLAAPVLMLAYTRFVFAALTGLPIKWGPQARGAERSSWAELWSAHREQTLFGVLVVIAVGWRGPAMLPWMIPLLLGLLLALPLSRASGSVALAEKFRKLRIFLTPEEVNPPTELIEMEKRLQQSEADFFQQDDYAQNYGLLRAILDPYLHSIHISLLRQREAAAGKAEYAEELSRKLLAEGPASLTPEQRLTLLWDAESLIWLHRELWLSPNSRLHIWWQKALSNYNRAVALYVRAAAT